MNTRAKHELSFEKAFLMLAAAIVTAVLPNATGSATPRQDNTTSTRLRFAAVSVRPGPADGWDLLKCKGFDGEISSPGFMAPAPPSAPLGRCRADNVPLVGVVVAAYASTPDIDVIGFPLDKLTSYQIQAVAEDLSRVTKAELQQMLQSLLEDRFKAKVHREMRPADGYVLTVAKGGIKFRETSDPEGPPILGPASREFAFVEGGPSLVQGNFTMPSFAFNFLKDYLGMPVADKTDLPAVYDIKLKVDTIFPHSQEGARVGAGQRSLPEFNPPLPKALEDQLGLHLERAKVQVEVLVIDHLEKATEN
jgi:uncharacterized protein (TIGR03435 family)